MKLISYARHQYPPAVIQHAVWLYLRFNMSLRDTKELLAERGLDTRYETVRRWVAKFGPAYAFNHHRHLISRRTLRLFREAAFAQWTAAVAAA